MRPIADVCLGLEGDCVNEGAGNSEARYLFGVVGGRSKEPVVGLLVPLPPRKELMKDGRHRGQETRR